MKKIFSFVIVAAAVAMVSCAGNSSKPAVAVETVAVEAVVEQCDSTACAACPEKCDSTATAAAEGCCKK